MKHNTSPTQLISWHLLDSQVALDYLQINTAGLTDVEVARSKANYGSNDTFISNGKSANLKSLIVPWKHALIPIILFLFFITIILVLLNEIESVIPIILIVGLNLSIVIFQVYQTEKVRSSLDSKVHPIGDFMPLVEVQRNGKIQHILAQDLVVGDILLLKQGDSVLADGRLLESVNLYIDESSLTGETCPVGKICHVVDITDNPLRVYSNMVYKGTKVVRGYGTAVVVGIGKNTQFDQIIYSYLA